MVAERYRTVEYYAEYWGGLEDSKKRSANCCSVIPTVQGAGFAGLRQVFPMAGATRTSSPCALDLTGNCNLGRPKVSVYEAVEVVRAGRWWYEGG